MLDDTTEQDSAVVAMDLLSDSINNAREGREQSVLDIFVKAIADAVNPPEQWIKLKPKKAAGYGFTHVAFKREVENS